MTISKDTGHTLEKTIGLPLIESAGGLVCNDDSCILMIFKRGKWDLPKGRVEGDGYEIAALREVHEETGLSEDKLEVTGLLVPTWHTTRHGKQKYLKKTHWYLMRYQGHNDDVLPQVGKESLNAGGYTSVISASTGKGFIRVLTTLSNSGTRTWPMCRAGDWFNNILLPGSALVRQLK